MTMMSARWAVVRNIDDSFSVDDRSTSRAVPCRVHSNRSINQWHLQYPKPWRRRGCANSHRNRRRSSSPTLGASGPGASDGGLIDLSNELWCGRRRLLAPNTIRNVMGKPRGSTKSPSCRHSDNPASTGCSGNAAATKFGGTKPFPSEHWTTCRGLGDGSYGGRAWKRPPSCRP